MQKSNSILLKCLLMLDDQFEMYRALIHWLFKSSTCITHFLLRSDNSSWICECSAFLEVWSYVHHTCRKQRLQIVTSCGHFGLSDLASFYSVEKSELKRCEGQRSLASPLWDRLNTDLSVSEQLEGFIQVAEAKCFINFFRTVFQNSCCVRCF